MITAYAVAEAIIVPLTGWLTKKFGAQRIFPKDKATLATVVLAMTTLIGPIAGPILGGLI